ncbi:hypothetical protein DOY81_009754 [Sarcophaga bullata]|nr:hypothetical protein DOY81_009754 [Sarcophaga bullata]
MLVRIFKQVKGDPTLSTDEYFIKIHVDKALTGQHRGRYNAAAMNDVAILMVGDPVALRDIIIRRRDNGTNRIAETHQSYDAMNRQKSDCNGFICIPHNDTSVLYKPYSKLP